MVEVMELCNEYKKIEYKAMQEKEQIFGDSFLLHSLYKSKINGRVKLPTVYKRLVIRC